MNNQIKMISLIAAAILVGLAAGYFIFGQAPAVEDAHAVESAPDEAAATTWTCSMHPQIRQNEPGNCPICGMELIPLDVSSNNGDPLVLQMSPAAVQLAGIQTTTIGSFGEGNEKTLRLTGKVQPDERLVAAQVAHVPGRIEQLFVTFTGEAVREGQALASIYSPELISAQQELLEALKIQNINPSLVEAARNKLRFLKISSATIAEIEAEGKIRESFILVADATGVVTQRRVAVGDYVQRGQPLFDLLNLRKVWVFFDAYEEDLAHIALGDPIEFTTPALPNRTFRTRVTFIDPLIDPRTRVARVRTEVDNINGLLKPEMWVTGLAQNRAGGATQLTVPKSAVLWTGTRSVVYVQVPDAPVPSFQFREVELGESLGDSYLLQAGLSPGETVVTNGNFAIDAAAQLNNQASMMNRHVTVRGAAKDTATTAVPDFRAATPQAFQKQLAGLATTYLTLKDALVATDATAASAAAKALRADLEKVAPSALQGEALTYWTEQASHLQMHTAALAKTSDIEIQRQQFQFISDALIHSVVAFGATGPTLYQQHCPMALDDDGADWLATETTIKNPYFGEKMMTCGVVTQTLTTQQN
jgi:membrane fusion protein, copper/silver efflux system